MRWHLAFSNRQAHVAGVHRLPLFGMRAGDELQRHTVVTIAQAGRRRTVVEHMSLVAATARTVIFGSRHDQLEIGLGFDMAW
jgi:hypothetical protein